MSKLTLRSPEDRLIIKQQFVLAFWSVSAAFGAYFCMYAFRKPFTAATYSGGEVWGYSEKTVLVTAQTLGYALSKFLGIRFVAEVRPSVRAWALLGMVGLAELALLGFGVVPRGFSPIFLFLNGLALGMVFGMVLGFLEGRRQTEALAAGLCTSFILADGITKSVGTWLLDQGIPERWMPGLAGLLFLFPLFLFTWMLAQVPPPDPSDEANRSERRPMLAMDRRSFLKRYGMGLLGVVLMYLVVTILRSVRADFAPEIWKGLGLNTAPALFTRSELPVALGVLVINGLCVVIPDNRRAFFAALGIAGSGLLLVSLAVLALWSHAIGGFWFMVLAGLGLYLPYVAVHTTIFERLLAMTRERGNVGFLMYLADATGYLGYVAVMFGKGMTRADGSFLAYFERIALVGSLVSLALLAHSSVWFARRRNLVAASPHEDA